nr:PREDICTED: mucin-2-like [Bemisia tabaci]
MYSRYIVDPGAAKCSLPRGGKKLNPALFNTNEPIMFRIYNDKKHPWRKGIIKAKHGLLHYLIQYENEMHKRHIDQLKSSGNHVHFAQDKSQQPTKLFSNNYGTRSKARSTHIASTVSKTPPITSIASPSNGISGKASETSETSPSRNTSDTPSNIPASSATAGTTYDTASATPRASTLTLTPTSSNRKNLELPTPDIAVPTTSPNLLAATSPSSRSNAAITPEPQSRRSPSYQSSDDDSPEFLGFYTPEALNLASPTSATPVSSRSLGRGRGRGLQQPPSANPADLRRTSRTSKPTQKYSPP